MIFTIDFWKKKMIFTIDFGTHTWFSEGKIQYILIFPGGKSQYILIFPGEKLPGKMSMVEKWVCNTGTRYFYPPEIYIVPAEITEPPKISGGQNHKYDGR